MRTTASGLSADEGWELRAACGRHDPDWWIVHHGQVSEANRAAVGICDGGCPVRRQCRQHTDPDLHAGTIRAGEVVRPSGRSYPDLLEPTARPSCGSRGGVLAHRQAGEQCCEPCARHRRWVDAARKQQLNAAAASMVRCPACDGRFGCDRAGQLFRHVGWWADARLSEGWCAGSGARPVGVS
jgi:hypothetical protein